MSQRHQIYTLEKKTASSTNVIGKPKSHHVENQTKDISHPEQNSTPGGKRTSM